MDPHEDGPSRAVEPGRPDVERQAVLAGLTPAALIQPKKGRATCGAAGPGDVVSPLAGVVLSIDVALGAAVDADTPVATLEAMKTKTMVKAGRSGTVTAIAVSTGQAVEAGQTLLTIA